MEKDRLCWAALPLAGSTYGFTEVEPFVRRADPAHAASELLVRISHETPEQWLLVVPPGARIWVNGHKPPLGAHALADHDEIRFVDGRRLYFSTERLPEIRPFPGGGKEGCCGRCRNPLEQGVLVVCCPQCATFCHQMEKLPCWRYKDTTSCPVCDQSNDPDAGFRWTPEGI